MKFQLPLFLAQKTVALSFLFLLLFQINRCLYTLQSSTNPDASDPVDFHILVALTLQTIFSVPCFDLYFSHLPLYCLADKAIT